MALKKDKIEYTETRPLLNDLKEEIPIEDIRDYANPKRIVSIDFVRGFAIIYMIIGHTSAAWLDMDWLYIYGVVFCALDMFGPSLFIFLSVLSVVFSIKNKQGKIPDKVIRNRVFLRGFTLIIMGIFINIIILDATITPFPLKLWGWNIIMFIGFSQIFSYYALKLNKLLRALIGLFIIFTTEFFRAVIFEGKDLNLGFGILHFLITSPAPTVTLLPWLSICFIATIFGEYLYEAMIKGTEDAYIGLFRIFLIWGTILVIIGLSIGWEIWTPEIVPISEYFHLDFLRFMNRQDYYKFPGIPKFLIRGTAANMFYSLGTSLLIIAVCFYLMDIKKKENNFTHILNYYGKVSLSLFMFHYVFLFLFIQQLNIVFLPFILFAYIGFLGFMMYIWTEYWYGVGSPEWLMTQIGRIGQKTEKT